MNPPVTQTLIPPGGASKPAYIMASSGITVSYQELEDDSNRGAQLFRQLGLQRGDHIAIMMENNPEFFKICWAAHRAGLYYTAISNRLLEKEVAYIAHDCGAQVFISSFSQSELAQKVLPEISTITARYMINGCIEGYSAWEPLLETQPATPIADQWEGVDMLYSSGTTGLPKGVKRKLRDIPFGNPDPLHDMITEMFKLSSDTIYLSPAPCYHAAPLRFNLFVQRHGGTCIIMESFDEEQSLALIDRYRVTLSQWVPTMFVRLLKLPAAVREAYDYSSLKCVVHAAAPCPVEIKQQMIDWWGPIIEEYYGATEGTGLTYLNSQEWLAHRGSVGKQVLGEVKIVDDAGELLPTGSIGTVYFESALTFEYHNDPDKTHDVTHPKGWTTLGDIGHLDKDGFLYLTDRKAFTIISGGVNIYPQEVENLLITHEKVLDAAVIGVPSDDFGEEVKAVIQPLDMRDASPELASELIAFCRAHLSAFKCPRTIDFDPELPRQPTGKLFKRLLKDKYWP